MSEAHNNSNNDEFVPRMVKTAENQTNLPKDRHSVSKRLEF